MTILKHQGYQGSVTFEDGRLVIQVLHIRDFLSAECDRASEAQKIFEDLVDQYLRDCAEHGWEPNKPFSGSYNVRISPNTHRECAMAAKESGLSLNAWTAEAIEEKLEKHGFQLQHYFECYIQRVSRISSASYFSVVSKRDFSKSGPNAWTPKIISVGK